MNCVVGLTPKKSMQKLFPNIAITFDLIRIETSNLDVNICLVKLYIFNVGVFDNNNVSSFSKDSHQKWISWIIIGYKLASTVCVKQHIINPWYYSL
jgi:hypothetical protein